MHTKVGAAAEIKAGAEIKYQNKQADVPTIYADAFAGGALSEHVTKIYLGETQATGDVMNGRHVAMLVIPNDQVPILVEILKSVMETFPKFAEPKAD